MVPETLITRCARQEPKAQYELYRALHGLMMSICTRYERNRQDAVARMNQGFLKVLQNIGDRRPGVPFDAWVSRIMINTAIDDFRKQRNRREQEVVMEPVEDGRAAMVNEYLRDMEAEAFAALLDRVPPMSRNVFNLHAIDGYAHAEIAELLQISEGTSKWHVANARAILQKVIAQQAKAATIKTEVR